MKTRIAVSISMLLVACHLQAAPPADASVGKKLDAQGLKYQVDDDGDYKLLFEADNDRSQAVWVNSAVQTLGDMRIRQVFTIGGKLGKLESTEEMGTQALLMTAAMIDAGRKKLGSWVLRVSGDERVFYFVAQVPADLDASDLKTVVMAVANAGEEFEVLFEGMTDQEKKDAY